MSPKKLYNLLSKCVTNGYSVMVKGMPGCGKTDIINQVANDIDYDVILSTPVVDSPIDYKGMGAINRNKSGKAISASFVPFGNLAQCVNAKRPTIYFIDDLGQAPPAVQAAAMQLILGRKINGQKVSDQVVFLAATNRRQDRAGVSGILEPVKSRFKTIVQLDVDPNDWIVWALEHGVDKRVIAFIKFRPNFLATEEVTADIVNHPCPRTWEAVNDLLKIDITDREVIAGAIGDAAAIEFTGFLKVYEQLPSFDNIIKNPDSARVPSDPAAQWAVVTGLLGKITKKNANAMFKYVNRLSVDFGAVFVAGIDTDCPEAKETTGYITWVTDHPDYLLTT
jgi:MoxR-like ATPase